MQDERSQHQVRVLNLPIQPANKLSEQASGIQYSARAIIGCEAHQRTGGTTCNTPEFGTNRRQKPENQDL
jgi:hypothetical protein